MVKNTLFEIGAAQKPTIIVFNKIDQYSPLPSAEDIFEDTTIYDLEVLKKSWMAKENSPVVFISATHKTNIEELKNKILETFETGQF